MAMKTNKGKEAIFSEINITPLTDIFLVLLIIMMVVAPTFQSIDNNIQTPEIAHGINIDNKGITVSISKEGVFYLNGQLIQPEVLGNELEKIKPTTGEKEITVKADKATKSKDIMLVMQSAQNVGYEKLTVAGEPLSKKEQNELMDSNTTSHYVEKVPIQTSTTPIDNTRVNIPTEG